MQPGEILRDIMLDTESIQQSEEEKQAAANNKKQLKDQQIQNQKDRTLFCINIDEKCSEEILYELFYQVFDLF